MTDMCRIQLIFRRFLNYYNSRRKITSSLLHVILNLFSNVVIALGLSNLFANRSRAFDNSFEFSGEKKHFVYTQQYIGSWLRYHLNRTCKSCSFWFQLIFWINWFLNILNSIYHLDTCGNAVLWSVEFVTITCNAISWFWITTVTNICCLKLIWLM